MGSRSRQASPSRPEPLSDSAFRADVSDWQRREDPFASGTEGLNPVPSSGESCKPSVPQLRSRRSVRSGFRLQNNGERNGDAVHMLWVPARAVREKYRLVG